jgi:hypothetical protein
MIDWKQSDSANFGVLKFFITQWLLHLPSAFSIENLEFFHSAFILDFKCVTKNSNYFVNRIKFNFFVFVSGIKYSP